MRLLLSGVVAVLAIASAEGPAAAAWHEAKSKHFIIYADLKPQEIKAYAERLERFDQAARAVRAMDDPPLTDSQRLTVYALRSEGAVARLAGMSTARGFYNASTSGAVAFVPRRAGSSFTEWDLDTEAIFFHEYAHHLQLQFSTNALPPWLVEGFAEFFATAKVNKDGSVVIGSPPQYRAYGLFSETNLSLEQMVGATYGKLNDAQTDLLYGKGWLLAHYLTFEPTRKGQLTRYVEAIQEGVSASESARAAFGDLKILNRELEKYKKTRFVALRVDGKKLSIGTIEVRPLGSGEAAIMDVRIRSRRGVDQKTAPSVAADARKEAAPYPNDPVVQAALAEAEYDAGNYAAAEAAADRALAADAKHVRALIYKGRARMELAKSDPKANWKDIRSWFTRANALDTENAEPLMLYFRSFGEAGDRPTKNAVDALLYSVDLAPQDNGLRVNAVRQLLIEGRVTEAGKLFAPLAFQPHAPEKYRDSNARIMSAIASNDSKAALAALEAAMQLGGDSGEP